MKTTLMTSAWGEHYLKTRQTHVNPLGNEFTKWLWPVSLEYSSRIPAIYLPTVDEYKMLNQFPQWIVRDGIMPLIHFFLANPEPPPGLKTRLYIHRDLQHLVPQPWVKYFGTYELITPTIDADTLLITGIMTNSYYLKVDFEKGMTGVLQKINELGLKIKKINVFSPPRHYGYGSEHDHEYFFSYVNEIFKAFGKVDFVYDWKRFELQQNFSRTYVVDLNSRILSSDSYLVYHAISRGASSLESVQAKPRTGAVESGPYFSLALNSISWDKTNSKNLWTEISQQKEFYDYLNEMDVQRLNENFPWSKWIIDWTETSRTIKKSIEKK